MSGLLGFGRDTLQAMSNNAAGLLSGPVDLINFGLLKAGLPMPANPVGGSASLRAAGLTRPVENQYAQALGDTLGNVLPIVAAAKGPQIAQGLLTMADNAMAPTPINTATGRQAGVFLVHTPGKPNPAVGSRYQREFTGGLLDKQPVKIEDLKGSSIQVMPWDSTSRNMRITSVSDELLPDSVLTTGGQDFARDLRHVEQNIGGASNRAIANRIMDRARIAQRENLMAGGSGTVYQLPVTMGDAAENFSTMPTDVLLSLIKRKGLTPEVAADINDSIRSLRVPKQTTSGRVLMQPFKNFKGIDTPEGVKQLYTGEGIDTTAGELRKAFVDRVYLKKFQQHFDFNAEDIMGAVRDPVLNGVPKGWAGNTVIQAMPDRPLLPSTHPAYDTDFPGLYRGSMPNMPVEVLMPKSFGLLSKELGTRSADLRTMVLGALEKRKAGISELVDDQVIDSVNRYLASRPPK